MDTRQLSRIDLNLLVALQVMLEERNVSRAAERLFVTQSAMSKTLGRLRVLLDDPLFTRTSHGMVPTPRAESLQADLACLLQGVQGLVSQQSFEPERFEGEFVIAIAEYIGVALLPALMEVLQREAPKMRIKVLSRIEHQLEELEAGNLDFAVHMQRNHYGPDFNIQSMGGMPPILLARKGHPLRNQTILWEELVKWPQVSLFIPDLEELAIMRQQSSFAKYESQLQEVFETSHLFTAIEVVRRTDCLMIAPPFLASHPQLRSGIILLPLPAGADIAVDYMMVSHQRTANSAPHQWLQTKIMDIVNAFRSRQETGDPYEDYRGGYVTDALERTVDR